MIAVGDPFRPPSRDGSLTPRGSTAFDTRVTVWNSPKGLARAGGDWSDAFLTAEHTVALTIGDVSGHGEKVAATMSALRSAITRAVHAQKYQRMSRRESRHVVASARPDRRRPARGFRDRVQVGAGYGAYIYAISGSVEVGDVVISEGDVATVIDAEAFEISGADTAHAMLALSRFEIMEILSPATSSARRYRRLDGRRLFSAKRRK